MTIEFSVAKQVLDGIIEEFSPVGDTSNEAQTRFSFIDRLLIECLGWPRSDIKVETFEAGSRTDYECGQPRKLIVEAKRSSEPFRLPPRYKNTTRTKLASLLSFGDELRISLSQVQTYCQDRGVQFAVLSNGPQLIVFLATRHDGIAPLDGDALVFNGYEEIVQRFALLFECLCPYGIDERRLATELGLASPLGLPQKLSSNCLSYFEHKYSSSFQENLRNAASLVVEDIGRTTPAVEAEFLRECYCESGPLTQYSALGKSILAARYAALFPSTEVASRIEPVNPKKASESFTTQIVAEAMARRPVILLGDVGVGKTSFIKHLMKVRAREVFGNAVQIYFDLGARGALAKTPRDALLSEIEQTLRQDYSINTQDVDLLEAVYRDQLADFDRGFVGQLRQSQPDLFQSKRIDFLGTLFAKREEHLRGCLAEIGRRRRAQVIIVIDNADQRSVEVQHEAFIIAQELASHWSAMVFLALRPQTFHASKRSGAVSAYPPKVFVIPPPKLEDAIEKRLGFALRVAEGRLPVRQIEGLRLHVESLALLIRALIDSLKHNHQLFEFIVNVSSGNVRVAVELVSRYFGSPNVESERIVKIIKETGSYNVPLHEFAKAGLLGEYSHFQEESSLASNVYTVIYADKREHFLSLLLLAYLGWDGAIKDRPDGFVQMVAIQRELGSCGFTSDQIMAHIPLLTRKKLIEAPERRLLESDLEIRDLGMPDSFRITALGAYHVKKWAYDFAFLEAICFDTPIFDPPLRAQLAERVNDNTLHARAQRANLFREYLSNVWSTFTSRPYFDWPQMLATGQHSFRQVDHWLRDRGQT